MDCRKNEINLNKYQQSNVLQIFYPSCGQHMYLQNLKIKKNFEELFFNKNDDRKNFSLEINCEICFHLVFDKDKNLEFINNFLKQNYKKIAWLFDNNLFNPLINTTSQIFDIDNEKNFFFEIGPRPTMITPFSTNAVSVLRASGIYEICRVEKSRRYLIHLKCDNIYQQKFKQLFLSKKHSAQILDIFGDKMTECEYLSTNLPNFINYKEKSVPSFFVIDLLDEVNGRKNLNEANSDLALGFDASDFEFYLNFFRNKVCRNPTDVELFDLAQSNSEHSRHWFFKGKMIVNGVERNETLFQTIQKTQNYSNPNNVIAFSDNSSVITGFHTNNLIASTPDTYGSLVLKKSERHIVYTAETHNFPTGVCPFPGAATGTGGRIRDVQATGRGAHEIAGVAGYSIGNLNLPNFFQPWENLEWTYPKSSFALPAKILLEASDGASDYGNKFGEPVICGFTRSFGLKIPVLKSNTAINKSERIEYVKPIMFSGGIGSIDSAFVKKKKCEKGQIVAKIGGPVYRIGVGGGAASSCAIQGNRDTSLDFGAVQRGDPEMEHKLHRVIRSCIEFESDLNPILSIHDQGAGGNGNVLKEIVEGKNGGAVIDADSFELGDLTITLRELWGAEYQESNAVLLDPKLIDKIKRVAQRERCVVSQVGKVTGDQKIVLKDFSSQNRNDINVKEIDPVNLNLAEIAERKEKVFHLSTLPQTNSFSQLKIPKDFTICKALNRILRLPTVASKRFLTTKVDRSVTGLIAQQQCVGPLQTPLADVAVTALSYWNNIGSALACGEQPIKGIANPKVGARMSVGEALTNLVFALISSIKDVKCSGNWMWAAKLDGEGARLISACDAMCQIMNELQIAVNGGKDSLSMAAKIGLQDGNSEDEIIKAPGTLVISAYAPCIDITNVTTPDFKPYKANSTILFYLKMSSNTFPFTQKQRLSGTALAQCLCQIGGEEAADLDDSSHFSKCFALVQYWISKRYILSGHDVSDGGFLTTILESAFAGNCGFNCTINTIENVSESEILSILFAEELGVILEVNENLFSSMMQDAKAHGIDFLQPIGRTLPIYGKDAQAIVYVNNIKYLDENINTLREIWEETSDYMESLQINYDCIVQQSEWRQTSKLSNPNYKVNFDFSSEITIHKKIKEKPRVAILREEGSNGDREMAAAFIMAGFDAHDITMTDLLDTANRGIDLLNNFSGLAIVGGFSYGDVLGSARGWAASILFQNSLCQYFVKFKNRKDTFSLGVCNGCQLMSLLGFIGDIDDSNSTDLKSKIFLDENNSGRFYSGFNTVLIKPSTSIFLTGMENSILGVWCSHGEGRFTYSDKSFSLELDKKNLKCIRYCDENGKKTQRYPENPNGSADAVAGITSANGRHLAMMPHPDRSFLQWQCLTSGMKEKNFLSNEKNLLYSPWIKLFQNAYEWTVKQ